ncbi:MAG: glycosyltransferase [Deltaproteobacteria bacterium]|nr:glycosyltransferase [Candidatus Zymogenaceae bacterium]
MLVAFMPHNKYHAFNMSFVVPYLTKEGVDSIFISIDKAYSRHEDAESMMNQLKLPYTQFDPNFLMGMKPDALVVMNDWSEVTSQSVRNAKRKGVVTVALIEGVQDFEDTHVAHIGVGRIRRPYMTVEYPFLIGQYDRKFLTTRKARVVGMPRIEPLLKEKPAFPKNPLIVVNSNFTYGLYTQIQKMWLDQIVGACAACGYDYVISKHHSDIMDFTGYHVSSEPMHDLIRKGSVFVSRFSTGLLESMALGKPVIYHNPHGERQDTFQDPMEAYPITRDIDTLTSALKESVSLKSDYRERCRTFFEYHVSVEDIPSAQRIALELIRRMRSTRIWRKEIFSWMQYLRKK